MSDSSTDDQPKRVYNLKRMDVPHIPKIHWLKANNLKTSNLPSIVDLRSRFPAVYNQGSLGSCVSNAIAGIVQFINSSFMSSRLFIYYNGRVTEGTVNEDSGITVYDGVNSTAISGVCLETDWPYNISQYTVRPPTQCYNSANNNKVTIFNQIDQSINSIKACLYAGNPIAIGISVYSSFESSDVARTGIVPMPSNSESIMGGHCVVIVGYDDTKQMCIMRNSWGSSWGLDGYFYMPYTYLTNQNLSWDFWTITEMHFNTPIPNDTPTEPTIVVSTTNTNVNNGTNVSCQIAVTNNDPVDSHITLSLTAPVPLTGTLSIIDVIVSANTTIYVPMIIRVPTNTPQNTYQIVVNGQNNTTNLIGTGTISLNTESNYVVPTVSVNTIGNNNITVGKSTTRILTIKNNDSLLAPDSSFSITTGPFQLNRKLSTNNLIIKPQETGTVQIIIDTKKNTAKKTYNMAIFLSRNGVDTTLNASTALSVNVK